MPCLANILNVETFQIGPNLLLFFIPVPAVYVHVDQQTLCKDLSHHALLSGSEHGLKSCENGGLEFHGLRANRFNRLPIICHAFRVFTVLTNFFVDSLI